MLQRGQICVQSGRLEEIIKKGSYGYESGFCIESELHAVCRVEGVDMTATSLTNKICATCQSWHGASRFNARIGVIELEQSWTKVSFGCVMCYKKSEFTSATNCRDTQSVFELP